MHTTSTRVWRLMSAMLMAVISLVATAQQPAEATLRPVAAAYTFSVGTSHVADTYLSPLKYGGSALALNYERLQALKCRPDSWVRQLSVSAMVDNVKNQRKNNTIWYWGIDASYAMMWRRPLGVSASRLSDATLGIGPWAGLDLGCFYSTRNGNNPASAKASMMVGVTAYMAATLRVGRLPIVLRYQPTLPVAGAFFSPEYGELYYEIYLGNTSGLAHMAWWGNYFNVRNLLVADLQLGSTSLRIGYKGNILTTRVNNLTTRHFTHSLVLGLAGQWLSVDPRKPYSLSERQRIVDAVLCK